MNFINIDYQVGVVKQPTLGYGTDYNYIARLSPDSYLGWKDVLNNFEQKQSKGECEYEDGKAIFSLTEKLQNLKAQSNNNWHFYGSYVYSDKKALTFLRDNETRLLTIQKNHERCLQQKFIPQPQIQSLPSSLDAPNSPTTNLQ